MRRSSLGLADQIKGQKPGGQRPFAGLHDRASFERGLMATVATPIALKPAAIDQPMRVAIAAGTAGPIGPTRLLQSRYCCAEASRLHIAPWCCEPLELRQRQALLELDRATSHDWTGI